MRLPYKIYQSNDFGLRKQISDGFNDPNLIDPSYAGTIVMESSDVKGLKIGDSATNDYGWRDILGQIVQRGVGASDPSWSVISGSIFSAFKFTVGDEIWIAYHIPHDYVPGTDIYFHAHWLSDGTSTATVKWEWSFVYADGFGTGNMAVATPTTATAEEAATGTAHDHMVTETTGVTVAGQEVDGMIYARVRRITNGGTDNTDGIFLMTTDVHYQSNNMATKNKAPNFYT